MEAILLAVVGMAVSLFGNLVGFGGGVFLVPILVVFFKIDMPVAVSISLVSLFPSAVISTINHHRKGFILYPLGILLEIPTILGTIVGSLLVSVLPVQILKSIFVVFVFILGLTMLRKKKETAGSMAFLEKINSLPPFISITIDKANAIVKRLSVWLVSFFGLLAGFLAGLFGIGGGFLKTPIMIKVFKVPPRNATATALFMIIITSLVGTVTHYLNGELHPQAALPVVIGFMAGAFLSGFLHVKMKEAFIEKLIGIGLILAGIAIIVNMTLK